MHAWCRRTTMIMTALMLVASAAVAAEKTSTVSATVGSDAKVNINTASAKELTTLGGVGPKLAERIVEYRDTHGPFKKPEDLKKVEGVGKALFDRNRERVVTK